MTHIGEIAKPETLRVLHVISNFGIGGAETWLIALLRYFKEHEEQIGVRIETDVFLTHGFRDRLDDQAEALGARLIYARYSRKTLPQFVRAWRRTLAGGSYAALHDHQEFTSGWHFLFGAGLLPPVRIAHLHNPMSHQESYATGWVRRGTVAMGNRLIAAQATHLLSTSRQLIVEQGFDDLPAAKRLLKKTVHCGFDARRFWGNREVARGKLLAEFGWTERSKILLFVGRLDSHQDPAKNQKNPTFALEVARCCAELDPDFRCLIAGSGDAVIRILRQQVAEWGLSERILLLGARDDVPLLMQGAGLLIFPSLAEGLGMVAVEAQAAGLRVLASDAVPRECRVVEDMVDFLALSAGKSAWAKRVLSMMISPDPDRQAAFSAVEDSPFSIRNSAASLLKFYQSHEPS